MAWYHFLMSDTDICRQVTNPIFFSWSVYNIYTSLITHYYIINKEKIVHTHIYIHAYKESEDILCVRNTESSASVQQFTLF